MRRLVTLAFLTFLVAAPSASAHQSPAGCTSNRLDLTVSRDRAVVRIGENVVYTVSAANDGNGACDITGAKVTLQVPGKDGQPSGPVFTLATNQAFAAGTKEYVVGTVTWKVDVNAGVTDAQVEAKVGDGVLHDAPADHIFSILKRVGTFVSQPHMTLKKTASTAGGVAPQTVTYTYELVNDSKTNVGIDTVSVTDDECAPLVRTGGDVANPGVLDVGETWFYTCTQTFTAAGTYVNTATATGTSQVDKQPVTAGPVTATVIVTTPPGATPTPTPTPNTPAPPATPVAAPGPQGQVLAATQTRPSACLATPSRVKVRAKELTSIRIKVNGATAGTLVTVTGPGVKRTTRTDSSGVATIRVKPTRSGTLTIKTAGCSNTRKVSVLAARKTASSRVPQVTG